MGISWDSGKFICLKFAQASNWIWVQLKIMQSKARGSWERVKKNVKVSMDEPICLVGDFNSIRVESERLKCEYRRNDMKGINDFIKDFNLLEVQVRNDSFTWFVFKVNIANWIDFGKC